MSEGPQWGGDERDPDVRAAARPDRHHRHADHRGLPAHPTQTRHLPGRGEHRGSVDGRARPGRPARPKRRRSLTRQGKRPVAPGRVARTFTAPAPDVLWCGDMTEIVTEQGKLYLATVIDLFRRRLLGYAMSEHHDADLIVASLNMAAANAACQ